MLTILATDTKKALHIDTLNNVFIIFQTVFGNNSKIYGIFVKKKLLYKGSLPTSMLCGSKRNKIYLQKIIETIWV